MKRRLLTVLVTLCLTLSALMVTASAVKSNGGFFPDSGDSTPMSYLVMDAVITCKQCGFGNSSEVPCGTITLRDIQYPVNGDYHSIKIMVTVNKVKCTKEGCGASIGPVDLDVTFNVPNKYFCHSHNYVDNTGNLLMKATSSKQTTPYGDIVFDISAIPKVKSLTYRSAFPATCTTAGLSEGCYYCAVCGKYFADQTGDGEPLTNVEIRALGHDYDPETGVCRNGCGAQAEASLNGQFKETLEAALADYNSGSGGTLRAFTTPEGTSFTLQKSGTLIISSGAAIPAIKMDGNPEVTVKNSGTIQSIEMNQPGTLTIENSGQIDLIKTQTSVSGGSRTIGVTNRSGSTINKIEAPNTMITVQNDGTIGELIGYFHSTENDSKPRESMVTLQRGAGVYQKITSWIQWGTRNESTTDAADFSKLLSAGDYFYFEKNKEWSNSGAITYKVYLENVYFTGHPFTGIVVTGQEGSSTPARLTADESGRFTMEVTAGQDITLTGDITLPEQQGLRSDPNGMSYSWSCTKWGYSGNEKSFQLKNILPGEYDLTLTVMDSQYNHSKRVNIRITAKQSGEQKTEIFLKTPEPSHGDVFTKEYDGTTRVSSGLKIEFYVKDDAGVEYPIQVLSDYYEATPEYKDPNCSDNNEIKVRVELTEAGRQLYTLGEDGSVELSVPAKITQAGAGYRLNLAEADGSTVTARVGDRVFSRFTLNAYLYNASGNLNFVLFTPGGDITVDGEAASVTFYRLHPSNIIEESKYSPVKFVSDPEMDEPLTGDSVFTYAGKYYIYAIVQPTRNYRGAMTDCLVIDVQETQESAAHHGSYTAWTGTLPVPVAANETKSLSLSGDHSTIYTELLLSKGRNLTLCLNGKTLSATNSASSYDHIRVTDGAKLRIEDCSGIGTVRGTGVAGGVGGIAYVKGGELTIAGGTLTGGIAKTGGAIVVDAGGVLNIVGGEISGNVVTSGNGGAIYVKSGGTVNIYGGVIRDNHVYSGSGGAIYVASGGTVNLYGGTITGNMASGLGGGICVEEGGTLNIEGSPVVTGNTVSGKANNVYLCAVKEPGITVTGEMMDGAQIGVTTAGEYPAMIVSGAKSAQNCAAYFSADDPDAIVARYDNALCIITRPVATLSGNTLTVKTGTLRPGLVLLAAEYDASGRMLSVQSLNVEPQTAAYTFMVSASGAAIKCFLLEAISGEPLIPAFAPVQ